MKKFLILVLSVVIFSSCFGTQGAVNRVTRSLALTVRTFVSFFQEDLGNCEDFTTIYDELTETIQDCNNPGEGTFQVTKISIECQDGPPLNGNIVLILNQINCQDNGTDVTSTGNIMMTLSFTTAGNIGILATQDLFAEEQNYVFEDFEAKVELSNNNLSCSDSGDLTVDGDNCSVTSDCRKCTF